LWGAGLSAAGKALGDNAAVDAEQIAGAVGAYAAAIRERGGAELGNKTMVDAIVPFEEALKSGVIQGLSITDAWRAAASVAQIAADDTAHIASSRGRSRLHGVRSIGTADPGAASFALIVSSALSS
jgi:dihydroxyacetone kinase